MDETTTDDVPKSDGRWMVGRRTDGPNLRSREGLSIDSDLGRLYKLYLVGTDRRSCLYKLYFVWTVGSS